MSNYVMIRFQRDTPRMVTLAVCELVKGLLADNRAVKSVDVLETKVRRPEKKEVKNGCISVCLGAVRKWKILFDGQLPARQASRG